MRRGFLTVLKIRIAFKKIRVILVIVRVPGCVNIVVLAADFNDIPRVVITHYDCCTESRLFSKNIKRLGVAVTHARTINKSSISSKLKVIALVIQRCVIISR